MGSLCSIPADIKGGGGMRQLHGGFKKMHWNVNILKGAVFLLAVSLGS